MPVTDQRSQEPPFFDTSQWVKSPWYRFLQPGLEKATRITKINDLARDADSPGISADQFAKNMLANVGFEWTLDTSKLPERDERGWLILGNHPTGFGEAMVMMRILHQLDPEKWQLLGNEFIAHKPQFEDHVIALDPFNAGGGERTNRLGLLAATKALRKGGIVGAFPAGRVAAQKDTRGFAVDQPWSTHFIRLAQVSRARILVARMPWVPGPLLRHFPVGLPSLRALLLSQELLRHRNHPKRIELLAAPTDLPEDPQLATDQLQAFCHEFTSTYQHCRSSRPRNPAAGNRQAPG